MIKNKKIILIGATGVLGSHYVKRFIEEKTKLVAVDLPGQKFEFLKKKI